jgi:hypothetical protein
VLDRLRALPGVTGAAVGIPLPLAGDQIDHLFQYRGTAVGAIEPSRLRYGAGHAGLFPDCRRIPVQEGRGFAESDDATSPPVLVVNRAFADKFFPGERVIGKRIEPGATADNVRNGMREIVGVVGNAGRIRSAPRPIRFITTRKSSFRGAAPNMWSAPRAGRAARSPPFTR